MGKEFFCESNLFSGALSIGCPYPLPNDKRTCKNTRLGLGFAPGYYLFDLVYISVWLDERKDQSGRE